MEKYEPLEVVLMVQNVIDIPVLEEAVRLNKRYDFVEPIKGIYEYGKLTPMGVLHDENDEALNYYDVVDGNYNGLVNFGRLGNLTLEDAIAKKIVTTTPGRISGILYAILNSFMTEMTSHRDTGHKYLYSGTPGTYPITSSSTLEIMAHTNIKDLAFRENMLDIIFSEFSEETIEVFYGIADDFKNNVICVNIVNGESIRFSIGPDYRALEWTMEKDSESEKKEIAA